MVFFNYALRKLNAKIVYYGPGLCGKTTNLQWVHDNFEGGQRGKMISLATEGDRTIFFDLLPLDIGSIRGMQVTLQLYTVPGQVYYASSRKVILNGVDGLVFVADSQSERLEENIDSLEKGIRELRRYSKTSRHQKASIIVIHVASYKIKASNETENLAADILEIEKIHLFRRLRGKGVIVVQWDPTKHRFTDVLLTQVRRR